MLVWVIIIFKELIITKRPMDLPLIISLLRGVCVIITDIMIGKFRYVKNPSIVQSLENVE